MIAVAPANLDAYAAALWTLGIAFAPRVVSAAGLLIAGVFASRWAAALTRRIAERAGRVDPTLEPILATAARYGVLIVVVIAALSQLGVQTASALAVLGAGGLAIGLALQGTLSNIAAGIMLLWLRPFRVGDSIEVIGGNPVAGAVREIGLFACLMENCDGAMVFAPNSTIWNFALRNHGGDGARLVSFCVGLAPTADLERARALVVETMVGDGRIVKTPAPDVFVDQLDDGDFALTCRLWTTPGHAGAVQRSMIAQIERRLGAAAVPLAPRGSARAAPPDSSPARLMASEPPAPDR
ncbi:MAG: mechanosensitive ion channel domain-containing protein [Roseiarcus sp.]